MEQTFKEHNRKEANQTVSGGIPPIHIKGMAIQEWAAGMQVERISCSGKIFGDFSLELFLYETHFQTLKRQKRLQR